MMLVVDTNRIIAALVKDGASRGIILHFDGELMTLAFSKDELEAHRSEILAKAGITETDLDMILEKLFSRMVVLDDRIIEAHIDEARKIMEKTDPSDVPFIAAALATRCPIWSDDKHFRMQTAVRVISTSELLDSLRKR